jgi:hypothetical protein
MGQLDPRRLVFIDETWIKTKMAPIRGWGRKGKRLKGYAPHGHWSSMTFIAALRWALHGFTDRLCIRCIVLVGLHKRFDELWCDQPHFVAKTLQFTSPVMRTPTIPTRQGSSAAKNASLPPSQPLLQDRFAFIVGCMNLKNVFCQIKANGGNSPSHGRLLLIESFLTLLLWLI